MGAIEDVLKEEKQKEKSCALKKGEWETARKEYEASKAKVQSCQVKVDKEEKGGKPDSRKKEREKFRKELADAQFQANAKKTTMDRKRGVLKTNERELRNLQQKIEATWKATGKLPAELKTQVFGYVFVTDKDPDA